MDDRRGLLVEHRRVGNDHRVAGEQLFAGGDERLEIRGTDFFFAFDEELHVDRARTAGFQVRLERVDVDDELALVVAGAPRVEPSVSHRRLERRARPQLDRVLGLHVVMAINEDRRLSGRSQPLSVDDGMALGLEDLGSRAAGTIEARLDPGGSAFDFPGAGRIGRNRRNPKDFHQLVQVAVAVVSDEGGGGAHGGSGLLTSNRTLKEGHSSLCSDASGHLRPGLTGDDR